MASEQLGLLDRRSTIDSFCRTCDLAIDEAALKHSRHILIATALILLPTLSSRVAGQASQERRRASVGAVSGVLRIDGQLDEDAWASAPAIGDLQQREPQEGAPPTQKTDVRLLQDRNNLFIGVTCFDSEARGVIGTQMSRDADLSADDRIEILLDTFGDRRNAFYFATNPLGSLVDALVIENGQLNREWDAIWDVRTHRYDDRWTAEFAIPFKSLGFNRNADSWGFNIARSIKRLIEEDRWSAARLNVRFLQVSEAWEIDGLTGLEQGAGLDVRPYLTGNQVHTISPPGDTTKGDGGVDVFYNLSPSMKWTTTLNTDFAETEVDNRQINLTRFPLFFPEKRAFFLENSGVFSFSGPGGDAIPFFSRRIGLQSGREVPILAGTKLAGKAGRFDIGVLDVSTRRSGPVEARNLFVGRIKRNLWRQSYVGGILTNGNPSSTASSRTAGADVHLSTANLFDTRRNFSVDVYGVRTHNADVRGSNGLYGTSVAFPNDLWNIQVDYLRIERNFRPTLGFVPRSNVTKTNISVDFSPRPKHFLGVRRMLHEFRYTRFVRIDKGLVESWRVFTAPVNYNFNSGEHFELNYVPTFERLFAPFEISRGVVLKPGDYRFDRYRIELFTSNKRPWKADATFWTGSYWSGRADQITGQLQYKAAPHFQAIFRWDQTFARLPEGHFVARIFSLRGDYSVSPFLTFFNLVQFDNESRNLSWQGRMRWILKPGRDVFVVLNQGWIQNPLDRNRFKPADRGLAAKVQYTFRF